VAREMGDLSENFEYKSARARAEYLAARAGKLQGELGNVRVVDDKSAYLPIPKGLTKPAEILKQVKSVLRPMK